MYEQDVFEAHAQPNWCPPPTHTTMSVDGFTPNSMKACTLCQLNLSTLFNHFEACSFAQLVTRFS